jgi:hypothetical protein
MFNLPQDVHKEIFPYHLYSYDNMRKSCNGSHLLRETYYDIDKAGEFDSWTDDELNQFRSNVKYLNE